MDSNDDHRIEQANCGIQKMETFQEKSPMVTVAQSMLPRDKKSLSFSTSKAKTITIDDQSS